MTELLLDSDAFHCVRKLALVAAITCRAPVGLRFVMTEYIARHELNDVASDIAQLEASEWLRVEAVGAGKKTPTGRLYWSLQDGKRRIHKGEAEALAWASVLASEPKPTFISNDSRAREAAARLKLPQGDVMDFVIAAIEASCLTMDQAAGCLAPWDDKAQVLCRPNDYVGGFKQCLEARTAGRGT